MDKSKEYILDNEIPTISFIRIGESLMVNGEIINEEPKEKSEIESNNVKK
jgi:hypothetical protein